MIGHHLPECSLVYTSTAELKWTTEGQALSAVGALRSRHPSGFFPGLHRRCPPMYLVPESRCFLEVP